MAFKVLTDGFPTFITLSGATGAEFAEKEVQPPGFDGGGVNDATTMRNTLYRTRFPKKLISLTAISGMCAYDPKVITTLIAQLNKNQSIVVTMPDGSKITFYGWLNSFKPNRHKEGEQPTADFEIEPSNIDATGAEVAPTYTAGP